MEGLVGPGVVFKFEHRDVAIGRSAGQETSILMRGPGDEVDRGSVEREVVNLLPMISGKTREAESGLVYG